MGSVDVSSLDLEELLACEWLAAFGDGSFASSTVCGLNTRKYHGLLVAATKPPVQRLVLLSRVEETVHCGGSSHDLSCNEYPGVIHPRGERFLRAFSHDPFPRWAYQHDGWTIEKQLRPVPGRSTVVLSYTLLGGERAVDLEVRPLFALRGMHELMYQWNGRLDAEEISPGHHRIPATCRLPEVFFAHDGAFHGQPCWYLNTIYWREQARGYAGLEDLWMPGVVRWTVSPGQSVHFICSTEPIELGRDIGEAERVPAVAVPKAFAGHADPGLLAVLQAALQFIVESWEGIPGIMTGYPWAVPSGRDAMICAPGLLLVTGRNEEAAGLFRAFAAAMKDGLMPSQLTPIQV